MEIIKYRIFKQILTVKNVMEQDLKKKKVKKSLVLNVTKKLENVLNVLEADGITKKIWYVKNVIENILIFIMTKAIFNNNIK